VIANLKPNAPGERRGGRKKGTPNKATYAVKDALQKAFDGIGGVSALEKWAINNQTEFYKIYAKLLPTELKADVSVNMTLEKLISESMKLSG